LLTVITVDAQVGVFSKEDMIKFTPEWKGERFEDGRPKVPDDLIERMKRVSITQAWSILSSLGYEYQYEGDFMCTQPGETLVGRAVTAVYMPRRPDVRKVMEEEGERDGRIGDQISWPIESLVPGDVYVADIFGKVKTGPIVGDNLGTAIKANSGNGVVFDGSIRDIQGLEDIPGFPCFVRGWHPSYSSFSIMLMGLNTPLRMGHVTVMPGDVVLGKYEGVIFIPPHLAEEVIIRYERVLLKDMFGKLRLSQGKYTSGEVDGTWSQGLNEDYTQWLKDNVGKVPVPDEVIIDLIKSRTKE
jgi:regulator of RNase E activity RraA